MEEFCGMETLAAPKDMFWTPDIGIVERYKKRLLYILHYIIIFVSLIMCKGFLCLFVFLLSR